MNGDEVVKAEADVDHHDLRIDGVIRSVSEYLGRYRRCRVSEYRRRHQQRLSWLELTGYLRLTTPNARSIVVRADEWR